MKFTTSAIIATTAAVASALPAESPFPRPGTNEVFSIMAIRSASPIHYASIQAKNGSFYLTSPDQGASCGPENPGYAQFTLGEEKGDLYLYTPNPPQQAVVDRSGMGQGNIAYTTGVQSIGKNQQRGPFKIDEEGNVVFDAAQGPQGFQACPNAAGGGYSVWLAGEVNPGSNKDCVGFTAKAIKESKPLKCSYTN
jgi:hypothetical protein